MDRQPFNQDTQFKFFNDFHLRLASFHQSHPLRLKYQYGAMPDITISPSAQG